MTRTLFRNWPSTIVLATTLLALPCGVLAQHGGGTGGGGSTGGGGLSGGGGRASGVSVRDDLKGFHEILALQATGQQVMEFNSMMMNTTAASAELQVFLDQLGKQDQRSELARREATMEQALEKARTENKKFLDGLSEVQKSGLKEIAKKLTRADIDLAQKAKALELEVGDRKGTGQTITSCAQSLEQSLTTFRSQQIHLGEELSISTASAGQVTTFNLAPLKQTINFSNQPVAITTARMVSKGAADNDQNIFKVVLTEDLTDLQDNITAVLKGQLDKAERCGERTTIQDATLNPRDPASLVVVRLHFERWACFGRDTSNEIVGGNGTIEVKLTPMVTSDGDLRLAPEIGRVSAEELIGELLRSGSLGEALRDKVTASMLFAIRKGGDFKAVLPPAALDSATLRRAQFQGTGSGKLTVMLEGEIRVSNDKVTALTSELNGQSPSQETVQGTAPR